MSDEQKHETIWLQPWCDGCEKHGDGGDGRMWCQDDAWSKCDECEQASVKYVLAPPPQVDSGREEIARVARVYIDSALRWHEVFDDGRGGNDLTAQQTSDLICKRLALALRGGRE